MKTTLFAVSLFLATATAIAFYPKEKEVTAAPPNELAQPRPKIEAVFVLDTTGSMSGLIQAAKEKIWSIASSMSSAQPAPEIRIGLVAFRDRGDAYVTRVVDLSPDLDTMYATLMDFVADGGGDGPESVNQALHEAVHAIDWSTDQQTYRTIFLVGDAPAHVDYQDDVQYPVTLAAAKAKGIVVNTVQCGEDPATTQQWQAIAQLASGKYFQVEQSGSAVAIATPFDEQIAALSRSLDGTRVFYGSEAERAVAKIKTEATDKLHALASAPTLARRAAFNASKSGEDNAFGKSDLVDGVVTGRVDLADVPEAELPPAMQPMSPVERQEFVQQQAGKREELKKQIVELAAERDRYLAEQVKEAGGAKDSIDAKLYDAVRDQAASIGLEFEEAPKY